LRVIRRVGRAVFGVVPALAALSPAFALNYAAPLDRAGWAVEKSALACRLRQTIPDFGDAVFEARAGNGERFFLASPDSPLRSGTAQLAIVAPHWNPDREGLALGPVAVTEDALVVAVEGAPVRRLLQGLLDGLAAEVQGSARSNGAVEIRVNATPVYFQRAYRDYQACVDRLLPMAFDGIAVTRLDYPGSGWQLSAAQRSRLDEVARYLRADGVVSRVTVDGYSNDSYRRLFNLDLSRKRAQAVTDYLVSRGVDGKRIVTRYHGEQNGGQRQVLVRLERRAGTAAERP
jgi:hypothetical protein